MKHNMTLFYINKYKEKIKWKEQIKNKGEMLLLPLCLYTTHWFQKSLCWSQQPKNYQSLQFYLYIYNLLFVYNFI